jgi:hypothetical protein
MAARCSTDGRRTVDVKEENTPETRTNRVNPRDGRPTGFWQFWHHSAGQKSNGSYVTAVLLAYGTQLFISDLTLTPWPESPYVSPYPGKIDADQDRLRQTPPSWGASCGRVWGLRLRPTRQVETD